MIHSTDLITHFDFNKFNEMLNKQLEAYRNSSTFYVHEIQYQFSNKQHSALLIIMEL